MHRNVVTRTLRCSAACRRAGLAVLLAAVLGGCGANPGPGEAPGPGAEPPPRVEPVEPLVSRAPAPPEARPIVLPPEELRGRVLADAAQRSGLPQETLEVLQSLRITWRDGSLGCPEPGMSYTMALVPGWHMIILAGDELFDYRLSERSFMLCTYPSEVDYAPDSGVTVER